MAKKELPKPGKRSQGNTAKKGFAARHHNPIKNRPRNDQGEGSGRFKIRFLFHFSVI
jgi:hypothetical protein